MIKSTEPRCFTHYRRIRDAIMGCKNRIAFSARYISYIAVLAPSEGFTYASRGGSGRVHEFIRVSSRPVIAPSHFLGTGWSRVILCTSVSGGELAATNQDQVARVAQGASRTPTRPYPRMECLVGDRGRIINKA